MSATVAAIFPFTKRVQDTSSPPRSFKWTLGPDKHEIHAIVVANTELEDMLPHCPEVPSLIRMEVTSQRIASRKAKKQNAGRSNSNSSINNNVSSRKTSSASKDKKDKKQVSRISDNDSCPVHPGAAHTWGECFLNASNPNKKRRFDSKKSSSIDKTDSHVVNLWTLEETLSRQTEVRCQLFYVESMVSLDTVLETH